MTDNGSDQAIPFSPEAEAATLGAILTNPNQYPETAAVLKDGDDFFLLRHQWIWRAIGECLDESDSFDYLTVAARLNAKGHLDEIGGMDYLMQLINDTPTSEHASIYAGLVAIAGVRRRLLVAAEEIKAVALDEEMNTEAVIAESEARLSKAIANNVLTRARTISDAASDYLTLIEERANRPDDHSLRMTYGFPRLDRVTRGIKPSYSVFIGGESGSGKTMLAQNIITHICGKLKKSVYLWTGEMSEEDTVARFAAMLSGVNYERTEGGYADDDEMKRVVSATAEVMTWDLTIDCDPYTDIDMLRRRLESHAYRRPLDMVVIDYIGLLQPAASLPKRPSEYDAVTYSAKRIKNIGQSLGVPMLTMAQLNRASFQNNRPTMHSLKSSGEIENSADLVLLLHRPDEKADDIECIIAKHRRGRKGMIMFSFDGPRCLFTEHVRPATQVQPHYSDGD